MTDKLDYWAENTPDAIFLARREAAGEWRRLSYGEFRAKARAIGQSLACRGISRERPIAILSGNSLEHALLSFGAMYADVPFAPISPAYSLVSTDFQKLRHVFGLLTPGMIFASAGTPFARAIRAAAPADAELVFIEDPLPGSILFRELLEAAPGRELESAYARVGPDTVFKILFTSGSVALPKGVMTTHRMWTSNQEMVRTCWPFVVSEAPVLVEWMPWSHAAAGSKCMGLVLYNGGTMYIDDGRPVAGAFEETIRNLREIAPTIYLSVPVALDRLVPYLRREPALAAKFFSRLQAMFYAGAGLSQPTWEDLAAISIETTGERVPMLTALGSTETAPFAMWAGTETTLAAEVGLPAPGMTLKLAPVEGKLEARYRGPNITPGYWRQPELTGAAFDEEGFFRSGDALRYVDEGNAARGFFFDGRVAEDFKLSTGSWVSVGPLRSAFLAHFAPYAGDVAIAGRDRGYAAALVFPAPEACRRLCSDDLAVASPAAINADGGVRARFRELLRQFAADSTGLSTRIARIILLDTPPSLDAQELTDKGAISQRAVVANRSADIEELFAACPGERVITAD